MEDNNLKHIAIIMDGNRRWARTHKVSVSVGHRKGAQALQNLLDYITKLPIEYLTVYAFSTENWKRSKEEVNDLMALLRHYLEELKKNKDRNVRIRVIGDINKLDDDLKETITSLEEKTSKNTGLNFNVALNYGGRDEIINAVNKILKEYNQREVEITEKDFEKYLYTKNIPEPDFILRTANERRLSNFLLWQSAYSELIFIEKCWPDFTPKDLDSAVKEFKSRKRNFGGS